MDDSAFIREYQDWIDSLEENFPYTNPATFGDEEEFPIIASGIVYSSADEAPDKFKIMREGGFNLCLKDELYEKYIHDNYNDAADAKVKIIGWYSEFVNPKKGIDYWLYDEEHHLNLDAFGGIFLWDEPRPAYLTGGYPVDEVGREKSLWELYYYFKNTKKIEYLAYINLLPLNNEINEDYASNYQEYFRPAFFCYDYYPLLEKSKLLYEGIRKDDGLKEGLIVIDYECFYKNLEFFSWLSNQHSRPFWAFCESTSMFQFNSFNYYPVALEQYLRFEAFSALAYGAKGIVYWTYALNKTTHDEDSGELEGETYLSALLDRRNNRVASWYYAKRVNDEIHKYSKIFLEGTWKSVVSTNHFLHTISADPIFSVEIVSEDGVELLVAEFRRIATTYILVVSKDMVGYHNIKINVKNNTPHSVIELTPITSKGEENTKLSRGENSRILPPGGYRIFSIPAIIPK